MRWPDLAELLEAAEDEERTIRLRRAERVGRPIGSEAWLALLEEQSGRRLKRDKPGRRGGELSALSP